MYFYHGYALGVASTIQGQQFTKAECALSVDGGTAAAPPESSFTSTGKINISFDPPKALVTGLGDTRNGTYIWTTDASVVINNLRIADTTREFVKASSIEAHIISEYRAGDYEASISLTQGKARCRFTNLSILGNAISIDDAEDMFTRYFTYGSMQEDIGNSFTHDRFMACVQGRYLQKDDAITPDLRAAYDAYGEQNALTSLKPAVVCSFVKAKEAKTIGADIKTWGPIITVRDFGTIYLGEVIVWPWMRCLTMFRVELASGGSISGGSAGVNGVGFPPGAFGGGGYGGGGG